MMRNDNPTQPYANTAHVSFVDEELDEEMEYEERYTETTHTWAHPGCETKYEDDDATAEN